MMSRFKIVFTSDFHIHPFRTCSRDGGHDRLLDGLSCLRQSLDLARKEKAPWVFLGDFKMPKNAWPQEALTGSHEILREYDDVEKIMVAGNHDAEGLGGSGLAPFKDVATVVEKEAVVDVRAHAKHLICAPWNADLKRVRLLTEVAKGRIPLVGHAFLLGVALGPEDARIGKGASIGDYGAFPVAFFGDVHKGQWCHGGGGWAPYLLADPWPAEAEYFVVRAPAPWAGEAYYPGSPYAQNWGERDDPPKGALVVDLESGEVRLHPLRSPRHRHVELSTESDLAMFAEAARERYAGDFVRVVYSGPPCGALDALRGVGEGFRSFQVILRREARQERRVDIHAGLSITEILRRYIEARPPIGDARSALLAGERLAAVES